MSFHLNVTLSIPNLSIILKHKLNISYYHYLLLNSYLLTSILIFSNFESIVSLLLIISSYFYFYLRLRNFNILLLLHLHLLCLNILHIHFSLIPYNLNLRLNTIKFFSNLCPLVIILYY